MTTSQMVTEFPSNHDPFCLQSLLCDIPIGVRLVLAGNSTPAPSARRTQPPAPKPGGLSQSPATVTMRTVQSPDVAPSPTQRQTTSPMKQPARLTPKPVTVPTSTQPTKKSPTNRPGRRTLNPSMIPAPTQRRNRSPTKRRTPSAWTPTWPMNMNSSSGNEGGGSSNNDVQGQRGSAQTVRNSCQCRRSNSCSCTRKVIRRSHRQARTNAD
jgi:hypothetical protein